MASTPYSWGRRSIRTARKMSHNRGISSSLVNIGQGRKPTAALRRLPPPPVRNSSWNALRPAPPGRSSAKVFNRPPPPRRRAPSAVPSFNGTMKAMRDHSLKALPPPPKRSLPFAKAGKYAAGAVVGGLGVSAIVRRRGPGSTNATGVPRGMYTN